MKEDKELKEFAACLGHNILWLEYAYRKYTEEVIKLADIS